MDKYTPHEGDFDHLAFNDMLPRVLEEKVKTHIGNYEREEHRTPNIVILSNKARAVMHGIGLLDDFYSVSKGKRRVTLFEGKLKLEVYHIDEMIWEF